MKIYIEKTAYEYDDHTTAMVWLETENNIYGLLEMKTGTLEKLAAIFPVLQKIIE